MNRTSWTDERLDDAFSALRGDIGAVRSDLRTGIADVRTEIRDVRVEIRDLRHQMWFGFIAILAAVISTNLA